MTATVINIPVTITFVVAIAVSDEVVDTEFSHRFSPRLFEKLDYTNHR